MTGKPPGQVLFAANVELLRLFLTHRKDIVESIEAVLNAQRKPIQYLQNHSLLSRHFEDCFLAPAAVTASQKLLRGRLEEAHWSAGFRPRQVHDLHNDLIDPAEMMIRGFYCWRRTRWPGRNGRVHYAHTLFNLYVLRWLQFLSMRLWDEEADSVEPRNPGGRLAQLQGVLDQLWTSSPADQPVIVRDARWLIPLAQSLITDELAPYLEVAQRIAETLQETDALEIQKAHVRMLGGHLTSQIRYYCTKDRVSIDDASVVLRTRASNALDFALLVQGLVTLLKAYESALRSRDERVRLDISGAICQGISADPELFLNRTDLLNAYSMIEHVFIASEVKDAKQEDAEGRVAYTALGKRHVQLLKEYAALIGRLKQPLRDDLPHFRPVDARYSPYGIIFGLPSHLIEHMALKALQHDAETRFSLEDVFNDADNDGNIKAAKLAWVNGWRKLPHIDPEVQRLFEYPQPFAEEIYGRIESELRRRNASTTGRLYIVPGDNSELDLNETHSKVSEIPALPARYISTSDRQIVAAQKAEPQDRAQLLAGRREGHFLVSYETPAGWVTLKKDLLTEVLGAGRDARVAGMPLKAAQVLQLMCADLVIPKAAADASGPSAIPSGPGQDIEPSQRPISRRLMNDRIDFEIVCPNDHNQTVTFSQKEFEADLKSGALVFHCNTCDANWPPSREDIVKIRKEFSKL